MPQLNHGPFFMISIACIISIYFHQSEGHMVQVSLADELLKTHKHMHAHIIFRYDALRRKGQSPFVPMLTRRSVLPPTSSAAKARQGQHDWVATI